MFDRNADDWYNAAVCTLAHLSGKSKSGGRQFIGKRNAGFAA
jgi:hypothetical protein